MHHSVLNEICHFSNRHFLFHIILFSFRIVFPGIASIGVYNYFSSVPVSKKPSVPYTPMSTAVSSQLILPFLSSSESGMLILKTSFTGLFLISELISLILSGSSILFQHPVKITFPGQFSKTFFEAAESM